MTTCKVHWKSGKSTTYSNCFGKQLGKFLYLWKLGTQEPTKKNAFKIIENSELRSKSPKYEWGKKKS